MIFKGYTPFIGIKYILVAYFIYQSLYLSVSYLYVVSSPFSLPAGNH